MENYVQEIGKIKVRIANLKKERDSFQKTVDTVAETLAKQTVPLVGQGTQLRKDMDCKEKEVEDIRECLLDILSESNELTEHIESTSDNVEKKIEKIIKKYASEFSDTKNNTIEQLKSEYLSKIYRFENMAKCLDFAHQTYEELRSLMILLTIYRDNGES